ncbi:MAG: ATP-dependent zinc metalloprotease FtsH [Lachnospiraceae bacterium]|nr:ATP-dependent zinc metalloprotease FtsH [Lachnospiraceae bacterium]
MQVRRRPGFGLYIIIIVLVVVLWFAFSGTKRSTISEKGFEKALSEGRVASVIIDQHSQVPTGAASITLISDQKGTDTMHCVLYLSNVNEFQTFLKDKGYFDYVLNDVDSGGWFMQFLPMLIIIFIVFVLFMMILGAQSSGGSGAGAAGSRMMNFGKSRAKMTGKDENHIRFTDVAGLYEEKEEVGEIVDFLKDPAKYTEVGARIPKGLLMEGPPGTGKTLLARAIAGEAGVPFFFISGSDFMEMFVGVGASRVRDLFSEAKKNSPCIIFIDEIDAIARRRGSGMGGGHDEREQTLNQILVEMDGFAVNEGIIVLAATNRVDILDPAIMRPGRFDRKIYVGRPDMKGRLEILNVHTKNKPLGDDVDLEQIAQTSVGFTGADLENLMNEAAIKTAREGRRYITQEDIKSSFVKVGLGTEKKSRVVSEHDKKITAYHEAGHAILYHVLPHVGPVYTVSVIPTGRGAAGYTMALPEKDRLFSTKNEMLEEITVSLGGRVAEALIFGDVTNGASNDLKVATGNARDMVTKYGMSEKMGPVCYHEGEDEVFLGRDYGHVKGYGDEIESDIDREIRRIMDECYSRAEKLIKENMDVLHRVAALLIEKEKIDRAEFESCFEEQK